MEGDVIEFQSNPFLDALLFSGKELVFENEPELSKSVDKVGGRALSQLKASYELHRAEVMQLKYGQFLKLVEGSFRNFKEGAIPSEVRGAVASKLEELGKREIEEKEKTFSKVHRFFHKLGQFLQGHGFRTQGEFGRKLAEGIKEEGKESSFAKVEAFIFASPSYLDKKQASQALKEVMKEVNALQESSFKRILDGVIFKRREPLFPEKMKLLFYSHLSQEKKELFDKVLFNRRGDWIDQAFDIVRGGAKERFKEVISPWMVKAFLQRRGDLRPMFRQEKDPEKIKFFLAMAEAAIKIYLDTNDFHEILILLREEGISIEKLEKNGCILTAEDLKKLRRQLIA